MSVFRNRLGLLTTLIVGAVVCTGCSGQAPSAPESRVTTAVAEPRPSASAATPVAAPAPVATVTAEVTVPARAPSASSAPLKVKRLVIASGVRDREPVTTTEPMLADGTPIYAFAELANPDGGSENVRITFERRGGKERAGDVVLPIPGNVTRHRTWAFTRHIFAPGQWDAVLRSESGAELSRTSFDVKQS